MRLPTIFTPSFADADNTNAQNLTVKEIVARLPPEQFRVVMLHQGKVDLRIQERPNTVFLPYFQRGNTVQLMTRLLWSPPDIYFYPRQGPLDRVFLTARQRLRLRCRLVTHIVMEMNEKTASEMITRSVREADAVFANSRFVAKTVRDYFGDAVGTIYNGVDRRFFFPIERSSTKSNALPVVLYAGSFQPRKRVELVIRQAARFPLATFRLAGRGETESSCRDLAQQLNCGNVVFLGHLAPAALGEELRQADVFLFPSILEGHPQVLGQAAACGTPAIAMDFYHPDYLVSGSTGFLVESDDELTAKLDLLLRNSELRHTMSRAAIAHSQSFDWDRIAAQWAEVFQSVLVRR
jgi:glycosyltransferase involved in cell wall biosynthesis